MVEISKICLSNPKKTKIIVRFQHFIPPVLQKKLLGELIFLIQIKNPSNLDKNILPLTEEVSEIIINGLKTNYYTPENLKDSENIEIILENTLQKVNRLLYQEIIGSKIFEKFIKNLNTVIAVIKEEKIYFSPVGTIQSFILRKNKIVPLAPAEERNYQTPFKIFAQIISGSLEKEDVLIFSTDNFLDYFNFEKLKTSILKQPFSSAIKNLEKILENLKEEISLGAFLIRKEGVKVLKTIPEEKEVAIEMKKEEKIPTKIFVQPVEEKAEGVPIKERVEEKLKIPVVLEKKIMIEKKEEIEEIRETMKIEKPKEKPVFKLKLPKISLVFLPLLFKNLGSVFSLILRRIFLVKPKLIYLVIIVLAIFLALNLVQIRTREEITIKFFLSFQEIQEKNTLFKASLAYGDEKKALVMAEEIKNEITILQPKNKVEREILENLKKNFEENLENLYRIERIKEPKIIADFSSLTKEKEIIDLIKYEKNFLGLNQKKGEIYEFNQSTNKISLFTKTDLAIKKLISYSEEEFILASDNQIQSLNLKNKKISSLKLETGQKELFIDDLKSYDKKIYILDIKNNQVFKYLKIANGFGQESSWLKEKIDLKNITSLAIDGSIYLLRENGEILKFYLGKKSKFNQEKVYPSLEKAEKIFTEIDFKNIYLLEPINKRIIIFDKAGKYIKQITSDKFTNLKDFFVDEKETKIWLLNKTEIIEIKL